jgi:hypothetical protein
MKITLKEVNGNGDEDNPDGQERHRQRMVCMKTSPYACNVKAHDRKEDSRQEQVPLVISDRRRMKKSRTGSQTHVNNINFVFAKRCNDIAVTYLIALVAPQLLTRKDPLKL